MRTEWLKLSLQQQRLPTKHRKIISLFFLGSSNMRFWNKRNLQITLNSRNTELFHIERRRKNGRKYKLNRIKEKERRHQQLPLNNNTGDILFLKCLPGWQDFRDFLLFIFSSFSITKKKRTIHTPALQKKKWNKKKPSYTCRQMLQTLFNRSSSYLWDPKLYSISFVLSLYVFLQAKLISFAWQGKFLIQSIWCWIPFSVATSSVSKWISGWYLPTASAM